MVLKQKSWRKARHDLCCRETDSQAADFAIAFMHLVQSTLCTFWPFSITNVFCRFGLNVRLVARWEKERLCPKVVDFPQFAHLAI
jgi:hypothetical protein